MDLGQKVIELLKLFGNIASDCITAAASSDCGTRKGMLHLLVTFLPTVIQRCLLLGGVVSVDFFFFFYPSDIS